MPLGPERSSACDQSLVVVLIRPNTFIGWKVQHNRIERLIRIMNLLRNEVCVKIIRELFSSFEMETFNPIFNSWSIFIGTEPRNNKV